MPATSGRASKSPALPTIAASMVGARTSHAQTTVASINRRVDCVLNELVVAGTRQLGLSAAESSSPIRTRGAQALQTAGKGRASSAYARLVSFVFLHQTVGRLVLAV